MKASITIKIPYNSPLLSMRHFRTIFEHGRRAVSNMNKELEPGVPTMRTSLHSIINVGVVHLALSCMNAPMNIPAQLIQE